MDFIIFVALSTVFIFMAPLLNRLLTYLTFRYEVSTHGKVLNAPHLSLEDKRKLKDALSWWNKQCDKWYVTPDSSVDKVLSGDDVNLVDLQRISDATEVGRLHGVHSVSQETQLIFNALRDSIVPVERALQEEVAKKKIFYKERKRHRRLNDKIINEVDILGNQLKIARYAAYAAAASAVSAILLVILTYLNFISKGM